MSNTLPDEDNINAAVFSLLWDIVKIKSESTTGEDDLEQIADEVIKVYSALLSQEPFK
jgi:hypothetical protein